VEIDPDALDRRAAYRLMISAIVPRPIAFVTSLHGSVVNLAPFSYFNAVSTSPPIVMIAVGSRKDGKKDTWRNIEETREFVVNVVVPGLMDAVIIGAQDHPRDVSELAVAKLTPLPSRKVKPPRVAESPIHLECTLEKIVEVADPSTPLGAGTALILGRVVLAHVRDELVKDGAVDPTLLEFVGRLGGDLYARVSKGEIVDRRAGRR
jgi:flavin reductase (DIM6/NTAB) family NADH-FMN oxidoreductase RutF